MRKKTAFNRLFAKRGLLLILVAAFLVEIIGLIQYTYSKAGLKEEADARARSEMVATQLRMDNTLMMVENNVLGVSWVFTDKLNAPDDIPPIIQTLMENSPVIANGFIAFLPDYYPEHGHWYEPVVSRWAEGLTLHQVGGEEHDYFAADWYKVPMETGESFWSEPYFDKDGVRELVVTFSVPVYARTGERVAVFGVDVELDWLNQLVSDVRPYKDSFSTLVSREGQLIASPPETLDVKKPLRYESTLERTGWKMSVVISEDAIYGKMKQVNTVVLILQVLGILLLILIIRWTARGQNKLEKAKEAHDKIENELEIARRIQMSMIPKIFPPFPERGDIDLFATIVPAKEVGGDLYDFYIRDEKLFFCIGDVSGKGVPASLVMAVSRSLFRTVSGHETSPCRIVTEMNESMSDMNESNMFVTFFCGVLDLKTGHLRYCNAGHNGPVLLNRTMSLLPVVPNIPLGIMPGMVFQEQETDMAYDDALFLYTDGVSEAENARHELFGEERMMAALSGLKGSREHLEIMQKEVALFVDGAPQSDDMTMLIIHYLNKEQPAREERHLLIHNDIQQIPQLAEFVEAIAAEMKLDHSLTLSLNLALEEAVTNVIMYAYPEGTDGLVDIEATLRKESLRFVISDSGRPFDPTAKPKVDTSLNVDERPIGGLGIHLVRNIMDAVSYERVDGKNLLTLTKNI